MNKYESENIGKLRKHLGDCAVLLKKNGAFPLRKPCAIEAVGSGVRYTVKGGTGSGEVNSRYFVNIEEGLMYAGFELFNRDWFTIYGYCRDQAKAEFTDEIKRRAKEEKINIISASMGAVMKEPEYDIPLKFTADAAVYVLSRNSGEGNDRLAEKGDFKLTDSEVKDILALDREYKKFMLVINAGGPVDLTPVMSVGNILVLSQLGVETGSALADILLGKTYPSGKLATTWAAAEDYCSVGDFAERDETRYREGIYVGYRWFDKAGVKPLFPFGYGLGYTEFKIETESVKAEFGEFTVSVKVKNTGKFAGREVVQVYAACPQGRLDKELKRLAGFAKTGELKPGEEETVTVRFTAEDLASYDESRAAYVLEQGNYVILTGTSSADVSAAAVYRLDDEFVIREVKNLLGKPDFEDYTFECDKADEKIDNVKLFGAENLPVNKLDLSELQTEIVAYGTNKPETAEVLGNLTDKDLAFLNIGAFDPRGSLTGVIGDASTTVPGAAGETCKMFEKNGISRIVMADGPAGVRISPKYYEDKKGKHSLGSTIPESMSELMPDAVKVVMDIHSTFRKLRERGIEIKEQYATAIPIATAIAQSFDLDFARLCGDIVGSEMELFGVDLWLAPALNIHRNVLCGRNFEYFSEDPLISGKFASALTKGVQAHKGCGVTIKHYAANNQETNRYASNSQVSERAMREIYIRGFEICIKEADPMAVMTSYNLLNGTHTSERRDLVTDILRDEFGFDGIVMTDWVIGGDFLLNKGSVYGTPDSALVAASGHSLFMPGCRKDHKDMMTGLKKGKVTREQLIENSSWLIQVAERLGKQDS